MDGSKQLEELPRIQLTIRTLMGTSNDRSAGKATGVRAAGLEQLDLTTSSMLRDDR